MEQTSIVNAHYHFIYSQIVSVEDIEAIGHDSVAKVATSVPLVSEIIFVKIDLGEMQDWVITAKSVQRHLKSRFCIFNLQSIGLPMRVLNRNLEGSF